MHRVTENDIAEMRSRGFDTATLQRAEEDYRRCQIADQLILQIEHAFRGVVLGDGVGLNEGRALDDYEDAATRAAYRDSDEKEDWRKITAEDLNRHWTSLCFFDAEGMRFHLPAFLIADLRGEYRFGMTFILTRVDNLNRYHALLDGPQRQAVREFLLLLLDDPANLFDHRHIAHALATYWTEEPARAAGVI